MDRVRTESIGLACGILATVVAGIHLWWGIPRFTAYASVGRMPDPRPLAFVLSGHAIMVAITLVAAGKLDAKRTYIPGIVLMLSHIVGYVAWHTVLTHGLSIAEETTAHGHSHTHIGAIVADVIGHLINSPLALVSKSTEAGVFLLLVLLYRRTNDE